MNKIYPFLLSATILVLQSPGLMRAQAVTDTTRTPFQRGGLYDRPYILEFRGKTAIGGYAEMNSNYLREEGIAEGFSLEQRRFNIFIYSAISEHVKLTSELEFEHGTEEIALETALVDVLFATPLNFRAGILLPPIGRFNILHDSPRYDVIDRPLVSTQIIPATLSEVGIGFLVLSMPRRTIDLHMKFMPSTALGTVLSWETAAARAFRRENQGQRSKKTTTAVRLLPGAWHSIRASAAKSQPRFTQDFTIPTS